jgi:hypothetical protein
VLVLGAAWAPSVAAAATPPVVHATVDHRSIGLGDPFRYTVEARGSGPLTLVADTGPFVAVAPPKTSRSGSGGDEVIRVEQTLVCLDRACAPGAQARRVLLPPARASSGGSSAVASAPALIVVPRVPASAVAASRAVYKQQTDVPPPSTRFPPITGAVLLVVVAALLAAGSVLLLLRELRHPRADALRGRFAGGLEHALRLLRESATRPAPDRRRAADYAARAVAVQGSDLVAEEATRVAWSPPDPEPGEVSALAERIENAIGSGS